MFILFLCLYFSEKKYAIADLEVAVGDEKHLDVCIIAHNWINEDGENCFYPTYLAPQKQSIAAKKCMEPTAKFNTYPATIRAWFGKIISFIALFCLCTLKKDNSFLIYLCKFCLIL